MPQLNVVLHGLMAIYEEANRIRVFLPNVTDVHAFRAGSWLAETELRARHRPYVLDGGITPVQQPDSFASHGTLHVGQVNLSPKAHKFTHAEVQLPRPAQIYPVRAVPVADPSKFFTGSDIDRLQKVTKVPTAFVLAYSVPDVRKLKLEGSNWRPPQAVLPFVNLHIYAEEDSPDAGTAEHALKAFHDMIKGIFNLDISLANAQKAPDFDPQKDLLPPNVDRQEVEDLAERGLRLSTLGDVLRQDLPRIRQGSIGDPDLAEDLSDPFDDASSITTKMGTCSPGSAHA